MKSGIVSPTFGGLGFHRRFGVPGTLFAALSGCPSTLQQELKEPIEFP
jgi:hypothetical protein